MAAIMENVKLFNSLIRTVLFAAILGGLGFAGWTGYNRYIVPSQQAKEALAQLDAMQTKFVTLERDFQAKEAELAQSRLQNEKLQTSLKLLKIDHRVANVTVTNKGISDQGEPFFDVEFLELDKDGKPLGPPQPFHLRGDKLYIDCWLVKFDDHYIEQSDALRSASLCVFKSIWGDLDGPNGGQALDQVKDSNGPIAPGVYSTHEKANPFEAKIWTDFWTVSNRPEKQKELGIRASHGQVNYMLVEPGQVYRVDLRASDGISLKPIEKPPAN
jgi:outer membrane murein-binding lipoprotein Lpp